MRAPLLTKTLRDQRRSLVGWCIVLAALVWVESALWPTVDDMSGFQDLLKSYPEGLQNLFDLEAMTTGQGFLNAELYTLLLPIVFIAFSIGRGADLPAGKEEHGLLDAVLVTPISRSRLVIEGTLALVASAVVLGIALFVTTVSASAVFGLNIGPGEAAVGSLVMLLLGVEFGLIAVTVGSLSGSRALAVSVSSIAAGASYVLFVAAQFVDVLSSIGSWSPMSQALSEAPLAAELRPEYAWMAAVSIGCLLLACAAFARRDIPAH